MNIVMIIPTGIGCEIGGHAGDATPAAKLLGSCCDKLILHPNVVNASDINEMPENALYVEGSMLDRFLEGEIELKEVKNFNRILLATNKPVHSEIVNAASAARATIGADIRIIELKTPLKMIGEMKNSVATGEVTGWEELVEQVWQYEFDALAISSQIEVGDDTERNYWEKGGVNPWGGIEAKASKLITSKLNLPVAHAPVCSAGEELADKFDFVSDPRMAAEVISWAFLHCVLRGLHRAPRIGKGLSVEDIDVMVSPYGCWGRPHYACVEAGIPIVVVKENKCVLNQKHTGDIILVENYLEAAGLIMSMQAGVSAESIRRPLEATVVL